MEGLKRKVKEIEQFHSKTLNGIGDPSSTTTLLELFMRMIPWVD